jgi:hypothetical protein
MMKKLRYISLILSALFEIVRYEITLSFDGIGQLFPKDSVQLTSQRPSSQELERDICNAILIATCFHWKPVLCLQRAICTVRLLRRHGIDGRVVIGYRSAPLFFHAWVEANGRVVMVHQRIRTDYRLSLCRSARRML